MHIYNIIGIGGIVLIVIGIFRIIDWYSLFEKIYGDDPMKCRVYVDIGRHERFYDGKYAYVDSKYIFYTYKMNGQEMAVAYPQNWEYVYIRGRVKICVDFGQGVAKPLSAKNISRVGAPELRASLKSNVAVNLVNSIKSRAALKITSVLLLIAIVAGGFLFYRNYTERQAQQAGQAQTPAATQQTETKPATIEQAIQESMSNG